MDLSRLSLFRNDPQAAADILEHALQGDMDAQFAAGLIYAEGRGVPIDLVQSFYWFSKAMDQGDKEAVRLRIIVGSQMSDEEFERARHLVKMDAEAGCWEIAGLSTGKDSRKH